MKNKKLPWFYYALVQYVALGVAAIVLILGAYFASFSQEPSEPAVTQPRYSTEQEEKEWQEKQLSDLLKAMGESNR